MGKQRSKFAFEVAMVNHRRMAALEEMRLKMKAIENDESLLKERLIAAATQWVRKFLLQTTIIDDLFAYGVSNRKIHVGEYEDLDDCRTIVRMLKSLDHSWKKAVSVKIGRTEGGLVEVEFRAIGY